MSHLQPKTNATQTNRRPYSRPSLLAFLSACAQQKDTHALAFSGKQTVFTRSGETPPPPAQSAFARAHSIILCPLTPPAVGSAALCQKCLEISGPRQTVRLKRRKKVVANRREKKTSRLEIGGRDKVLLLSHKRVALTIFTV